MALTKELAHFITQRELARENHDAGKSRPWCDDEIINAYRFCNMQREYDRVTRWLKKSWRDPYWRHENFIPAMILARMVNWPPTLEAIGFPKKWDDNQIINAIHTQAEKGKAWTGAYVITTCGAAMDKALYVVQTAAQARVIPPYTPSKDNTLAGLWTSLRGLDGLGAGFIAAQVVADVKYTPLLEEAADWWTFAVPGPGSKRGLNRYFGYDTNSPWAIENWRAHLLEMIEDTQEFVHRQYHAQDWQNIMCEFDKWMRVKLGEGRPRSRYKPETAYHV